MRREGLEEVPFPGFHPDRLRRPMDDELSARMRPAEKANAKRIPPLLLTNEFIEKSRVSEHIRLGEARIGQHLARSCRCHKGAQGITLVPMLDIGIRINRIDIVHGRKLRRTRLLDKKDGDKKDALNDFVSSTMRRTASSQRDGSMMAS